MTVQTLVGIILILSTLATTGCIVWLKTMTPERYQDPRSSFVDMMVVYSDQIITNPLVQVMSKVLGSRFDLNNAPYQQMFYVITYTVISSVFRFPILIGVYLKLLYIVIRYQER